MLEGVLLIVVQIDAQIGESAGNFARMLLSFTSAHSIHSIIKHFHSFHRRALSDGACSLHAIQVESKGDVRL